MGVLYDALEMMCGTHWWPRLVMAMKIYRLYLNIFDGS